MAKTKSTAEGEGDKSSPPSEATASSASGTAGTSGAVPDNDNISTRVGTRTKKAKVVFDPSDNYVPRKRVRKADVTPTEPQSAASPVAAATKPDAVVPKSPLKVDNKSNDNNGTTSSTNGSAPSKTPRLSLSPSVTKQNNYTNSNNRPPKVLGMGSAAAEAARLAGPSGANLVASSTTTTTATASAAVRKQEFKREPNCDMCHKVEQQRRGFKLIDCSSCAFRAHSKCLRAHPVYSKFPIQMNFRCFQCIECVVCGKSLRGGNLLFCCDCQNAFHRNCHGPSSSDNNPSGPWVCKRCTGESSPVKQQPARSQQQQQQQQAQQQEKQAPPTVSQPPAEEQPSEPADDEAHQEFAGFTDTEIRKDSFTLSEGAANELSAQLKDEDLEEESNNDDTEDENDNDEDNDDENDNDDEEDDDDDDDDDEEKFDPRLDNFEDVPNWSCDDVYRYFKHYFPDYAHLFKEQEIDGPSLVLMRKSDILSGFGLKLGPAISLYQRIIMMQNNDRDFRLTWI